MTERIFHEVGCCDCGAQHASGWHYLPPQLIVVELHRQRCEDCQGRREQAAGQTRLAFLGGTEE